MKYVLCFVLIAAIAGAGVLTHTNAVEASASARSAGELFLKHCSSCHGKDGRGKTFKGRFNHARDLTDAAWQGDVSDERLFNSIMNGRGKKMPAYGKKLSEQEIESLVSYVRAFRH